MVSMVNALMLPMILAPLRRIERRLHPDADLRAWGSGGVPGSGDDKSAAHMPEPSRAVDFPDDAAGLSGAVDLHSARSVEFNSATEGGDRIPLPETQTLFQENPAGRRLRAPNSLRLGESCAADDPEYREIFGPSGAIQRCKEQFIGARFSPRKTLLSHRDDAPQLALGKPAHEPTEVSVIVLSRASHAA